VKHRVYNPDTGIKELLCDTLIAHKNKYNTTPNLIVINISMKEDVIIELFGYCSDAMLRSEVILNHTPIAFSNVAEYPYLVRYDGYIEYI